MTRTLRALVSILAFVAAAPATAQTQDPIAAKCQSAKFKAEARKVKVVCGCYRKARLTNAPVDQSCLDSAEQKLEAAIMKAELRAGGRCPQGGTADILCDAANTTVHRCCLNLSLGAPCRERLPGTLARAQ